jgi:hypothetical protein
MAWDVTDYKLENLGPDPLDPGIDWDAIARMIAEKEEAAKETEASEAMPEPAVDPLRDTGASLAEELRALADRIESL